MNQHDHPSPARFESRGHLAVAAVLALAFVTGGGASDYGFGDALTQWLALPLLVWAALVLQATPGSAMRRAAIGASLLVVATVAVQQLPLPTGVWEAVDVRSALARDLHAAGVDAPRQLWSLSPLASERGLWSLLPALAVFLAMLVVPVRQQRALLLLMVALSATSLLLGYLQLGAPQDSLLNPFPEWSPALGGFFANPNHQATALALSLVAIVAMLLDDWGRDEPSLPRWLRFGLAAVGILLLASLPLTGSRAAFLLAVLALVAVPFVVRGGRRRPATSAPRAWVTRLLLAGLAVGAIAVAIGWLRYDMEEEVRWSAAQATAAMGTGHAPWGAGLGSFVAWFDQSAPASLFQRSYFNHAHNEYAQWWLESGVAGLASLLAVLGVLLACYPRRTRNTADRGVAVAAWLGCMVLLLHSLVDYPLRTPALMTVAGLLAGIVVARRLAVGARRPQAGVASVKGVPAPV
ncbi:hypothetical protein DT603_07715 [Pseudoxanthomonas gei]|uniref:O-antigen ligase-related domain-containing protein n=1 Tax=Pseudoxanthomonas gei TaxID=1383030 RepID=A0ABX0AGT7_9GAMM|nr:O-antigen ligase family protein [Pseudoxanthomonas gei]NDK38726.1 hypothetical protein [Pseudoxanthomonas gei]